MWEPATTVEEALQSWCRTYRPTFSESFAQKAAMNIRRHLVPFFGRLRLSEVREQQLLEFIALHTTNAAKPLAARTLDTILSV